MIVVLTRLHAGTCVFEAGIQTCSEASLWVIKHVPSLFGGLSVSWKRCRAYFSLSRLALYTRLSRCVDEWPVTHPRARFTGGRGDQRGPAS